MHTPGPWTPYVINGYERGYKQWGVRNNEGNHPVCEIFYQTMQGEANARLIAAAPDMLDLLRAAYVQVDEGGELERQIKAPVDRIDGRI